MTVDCVITNSTIIPEYVINEDSNFLRKNIVIDQGKIVDITSSVPDAELKIDAQGLVSIPGCIDPHVHYGVYSPIEEAARTESKVAALGGITTMMRMMRLKGSYRQNLGSQLKHSQNNHIIDYAVHASILNPQHIEDMEYCVQNGITSFKLYMNLGGDIGHVYLEMEPGLDQLQEEQVNTDDSMLHNTIAKAAKLRCPVLVHAEDYQMCASNMKKTRDLKKDGLSAWSDSRPPESEAQSILRASKIAQENNATIYFVHIGSKRAMQAVEQAKKQYGSNSAQYTKVFVETCPHYLLLSHENQDGFLAKVMPPIRSKSDIEFMWTRLQGNQVDTIGTDHVANSKSLKLQDYDKNNHSSSTTVWDTLAGFPGMGTMLSAIMTEGYHKDRLSLQQIVHLTSTNSARIFGMYPRKGSLRRGADADITLLDLHLEKKVSADVFGGFSDYTVYEGKTMKGWPVKTLVRGKLVADNFEVVEKPGHGEFISRNPSVQDAQENSR